MGSVERARVQDLQNPDPDRPLAPHWRVSGKDIQQHLKGHTFLRDPHYPRFCFCSNRDPTTKVQQRGVQATQDVLHKLLEGMAERPSQKVLVVDMIPSRLDVKKTCCKHLSEPIDLSTRLIYQTLITIKIKALFWF